LGELQSQEDDAPQGARLTRVVTDAAGRFLIEQLPAGLYKIVAHKAGFVPAVVELTRESEGLSQIVELDLIREDPESGSAAADYWALRREVPEDVLRQIHVAGYESQLAQAFAPGGGLVPGLAESFEGRFEALFGTDDSLSADPGQVRSGKVDVSSNFGSLGLTVRGGMEQLRPTAQGVGVEAQASHMSVGVTSPDAGTFHIQQRSDRLSRDGLQTEQSFEQAGVSWQKAVGEDGQVRVQAQMASEHQLPSPRLILPMGLFDSSESYGIDGTYSTVVDERFSLETGVSYRGRTFSDLADGAHSGLSPDGRADRVDVYGRAGHRVRPAVLLEYGVYSVLHDGQLALSPQGGVVIQMSPNWQAAARVSGRVTESQPTESYRPDALAVSYADHHACEQGEEFCGQLVFSRREDDNEISLGATHREFSDPLRLQFNDGFFRNLESLYVVPGDRLPELQMAISRRLSPNVLARVQSNVATGGGGYFLATNQDLYQNEVSYIVTSIDTQFQATSTGVFLGFHRLQQHLSPVAEGLQQITQLDSDRLQLKVTQDLDVLFDLPAEWALQLNMELTKGALTARADDHEIRSRVLGGIGVKF
jgi:hypothetical protein